MAAYSANSVNVTVGSQTVIGNNTDFSTYASVGNIFKLANENVTYDIGAVNSATNLSLTAMYVNDLEATDTTLNSVSYQIFRDYTPNYSFPESVPSDKNLAYIFTKAVRMIDEQLKELEDRIASWH